MSWQLERGQRIGLCGPSGSGKSTLILKLLKDDSVWSRGHAPERVLYVAPVLGDREEYLANMKESCESGGKRLFVDSEIPDGKTLARCSGGSHLLLVVDDLLSFADGGKKKKLSDLAIMVARHSGTSCLFVSQLNFHKDLVTLNRNLSGRIIFYQLGDWRSVLDLGTRTFPEDRNHLLDCLVSAKEKYGCPYVFVNFSPFSKLPRSHIVYTALFKDERQGDSPIFFALKKGGGEISAPVSRARKRKEREEGNAAGTADLREDEQQAPIRLT